MRYVVGVLISFLWTMVGAHAGEFGSKEEAIAMVKRVQEQFKKDGSEATFKAITDKTTKAYHDRDLYPFVYFLERSKRGVNVAHGASPSLVGKNIYDIKDMDGKFLIHEMVDICNSVGKGWVHYKWPNPVTKKIEDKSSYVEKMGDYFVGVGIYRQ
jgi:signal transduction histidine kinase